MDSMLIIKSRRDIDEPSWDNFVNSSDEAWLWHLYNAQDAICQRYGREDLSYAVVDNKNKSNILAIMPLYLVKRGFRHILSFNYMDSIGGPALSNGLNEKLRKRIKLLMLETIESFERKHRAIYTNISLSPMAPAYRGENCPRVNPLLEFNCYNHLTQTWIVDLRKGKDSLWKSIHERGKRSINKADNNGIMIRPSYGSNDLDIYYNLHCQTYHRTGARPHPKEYFKYIWNSVLDKGLAYILFAEYNGNVIAAENFGVYKKAAIYWTGASSNEGLLLQANSLLQWEGIQWMVDNGIEWYETGEAFPHLKHGKLKGLSDFKRNFGGELYPYFKGQLNTGGKGRKLLRYASEIYHGFKFGNI